MWGYNSRCIVHEPERKNVWNIPHRPHHQGCTLQETGLPGCMLHACACMTALFPLQHACKWALLDHAALHVFMGGLPLNSTVPLLIFSFLRALLWHYASWAFMAAGSPVSQTVQNLAGPPSGLGACNTSWGREREPQDPGYCQCDPSKSLTQMVNSCDSEQDSGETQWRPPASLGLFH